MEKLLKIVEELFEMPIAKELAISDCENWDSLRHLNLVVALEAAFEVSFEPEEIIQMKSIADIEKILRKKNIC